jgi:hypothetical protein
MCDYSLHSVKSRPAKVGDKLTTRDFGMGTRGFAASENANVAVCVLPGTELSFVDDVRCLSTGLLVWRDRVINHRTAIFRQTGDRLRWEEKMAAKVTSIGGRGPAISALDPWASSAGRMHQLLTDEQRAQLAVISSIVRFKKREIIYQKGDPRRAARRKRCGIGRVRSCVRPVCAAVKPLAIMPCADRVPIESTHSKMR